VPMRIIAFAEDAPVLLRGQSGIVVKMRSGKLEFARQVDHIIIYLFDAPTPTEYSLPFHVTLPLA
jgi:hypothetical protein